MHLKDLPGHSPIKSYFDKISRENRIPHALLLTGPKGSGKLSLARGLANLLMCKEPVNGSSCGNCSACHKTEKNIHPDIHFSFPVTSIKGKQRKDVISKNFLDQFRNFMSNHPYGDMEKWGSFIDAVDQPFNMNVAESNDIIKNLSLQSFEGSYKIQIIWSAEYLKKEGNRLLKLIEEPTDKTLIILITDTQEDLLNTILSRCQIIQVPPFTDEDIMTTIEAQAGASGSQLQQLTYLAAGNMDYAMDVSVKDSDLSQLLLDWLRAAHSGQPEKIQEWINPMIAQGKATQKAFFKYGLHFFEEYIRYLYLGEMSVIKLTEPEKQTAQNMTRIIDLDKAEHLVKTFNNCLMNIRRNANNRIMFWHQSLRIEQILREENTLSYNKT